MRLEAQAWLAHQVRTWGPENWHCTADLGAQCGRPVSQACDGWATLMDDVGHFRQRLEFGETVRLRWCSRKALKG